jgi:hypothetical protein
MYAICIGREESNETYVRQHPHGVFHHPSIDLRVQYVQYVYVLIDP